MESKAHFHKHETCERFFYLSTHLSQLYFLTQTIKFKFRCETSSGLLHTCHHPRRVWSSRGNLWHSLKLSHHLRWPLLRFSRNSSTFCWRDLKFRVQSAARKCTEENQIATDALISPPNTRTHDLKYQLATLRYIIPSGNNIVCKSLRERAQHTHTHPHNKFTKILN